MTSKNTLIIGTRGSALALAQAEPPPDLILLDVMMPGMDGYEVCRRLKGHAATANIPVLFVSSRDEEEDEARGLSLGAIDYIVKPIRPSIVQARVRNHLDLKRSRDLLQRLTTQDHLTGISNRRRFDDFLDMEWRRAAREQAPISLIAIDIDHFKAYNDHYGHPGGDQCLIEVARTLATCVTRPCDLVARCATQSQVGDVSGFGQQLGRNGHPAVAVRIEAGRAESTTVVGGDSTADRTGRVREDVDRRGDQVLARGHIDGTESQFGIGGDVHAVEDAGRRKNHSVLAGDTLGTLLALEGLDGRRGELVLGDGLVLELLAGDRVVLDLGAVDETGGGGGGTTDDDEQGKSGDDGGGTELLDGVDCVLHGYLHSVGLCALLWR